MYDSIDEVNSVFEQPWWLNIVAPEKWEAFESRKNGKLYARFPFAKMSLYGIPYIGIPEFSQQLGPWFRLEKNMKLPSQLKFIKEETENFIEYLKSFKSVDMRFHTGFSYMLPFLWNGYRVEPQYTYVIDNLADETVIKDNMDAKLRNIIKSAEKKLVVVEDIDFEDLIKLYGMTFSKQGRKIPHSRELLQRIYIESYRHNAGKSYGAIEKETGTMVAVAFFLYDFNRCYYLIGGKDYSRNVQGAQELLILEGIKFSRGVSKCFDFEGSMIPGIEKFFRGWGGEPKVYYRVIKENISYKIMMWVKRVIKNGLGYR